MVHIAGVPVGVATCWEVIFDRAPRKSVLNGAQLLAVPSNNATFNKTMSEQQLAFAKVRAVEHDRYVVVAGTTGISAVIAPDGGELARTDFFVPAYLDTQVRLKTDVDAGNALGPDPAVGPGRGGRRGAGWPQYGTMGGSRGGSGVHCRTRIAAGPDPWQTPQRRRAHPQTMPDGRDDAEPPAR